MPRGVTTHAMWRNNPCHVAISYMGRLRGVNTNALIPRAHVIDRACVSPVGFHIHVGLQLNAMWGENSYWYTPRGRGGKLMPRGVPTYATRSEKSWHATWRTLCVTCVLPYRIIAHLGACPYMRNNAIF